MESFVAETVKDKETISRPTGTVPSFATSLNTAAAGSSSIGQPSGVQSQPQGSPSSILKKYAAKLSKAISNPEQLAHAMYSSNLISEKVQNNILTTKDSRFNKARMLMYEIYSKASTATNSELLLNFCSVLKSQDDPSLAEIAEEIAKELHCGETIRQGEDDTNDVKSSQKDEVYTTPSPHASPSSKRERNKASDVIRQHYVALHNILSVSPETLFSVSARCFVDSLIDLNTKRIITSSASQDGSSILLDHIQMKLDRSGDYLPLVLSIFKEEVSMKEVGSKMESFVAETVKDKETIPRPTGGETIRQGEDDTNDVKSSQKDEDYIKLLHEALEEGFVEAKWTTFGLTGASGVGKSSLLRMLMGGDPPPTHDSSPVVTASEQCLVKERPVQSHLYREESEHCWQPVTVQTIKKNLAEAIKEGKRLAKADAKRPYPFFATQAPQYPTSHRIPENVPELTYSTSKVHLRLDTVTNKDILDLLRKARKSGKLYETHWINALDSGGQAAFLDIASALLRYHSSNVVLVKLNEKLHDKVKFYYSIKGERLGENETREITNLQLVCQSFHTNVEYQPPTLRGTNVLERIGKPCFLIAGTFHDMYLLLEENSELGETLADKDAILCMELKKFEKIRKDFKAGNDQVIFPINTQSRDDPTYMTTANRIRKIISSSYIKAEIPLRWFLLQIELSEKKTKGTAIVSFEECVEIGSNCYMGQEMVKAALRYFHTITICLYYPEVLPHIVFVDPQPLFDWLTKLVAVSYSSEGFEDFQCDVIRNLKKKGTFDRALVEKLSTDKKSLDVDDFLKLMIHLLIIAKLPKKARPEMPVNELQYFIPSVLQTIPNPLESLLSSTGKPFFLSWKDAPVPRGLFTFVLVYLLGLPEFELAEGEVYRNKVELECLKFGGRLLSVESFEWLGFAYNGNQKHYCTIHKHVQEGVIAVVEKFQWNKELSTPVDLVCCPVERCQGQDFHFAWLNGDCTEVSCCEGRGSVSVQRVKAKLPWITQKGFHKV